MVVRLRGLEAVELSGLSTNSQQILNRLSTGSTHYALCEDPSITRTIRKDPQALLETQSDSE